MVAPIIPGLNDEDIPAILEAARDAGARHCGRVLLRLPGAVSSVFVERLQSALPLRADKVLSQLGACRESQSRSSDFGTRMVGAGPRWRVIEALFDNTARKLGFTPVPPVPDPSPYRRSEPQLSLF